MRDPRSFLVISEDTDRLMLISNTLHLKFPNSVVQTCRDSEVAVKVSRTQQLDAIIAHRSSDMDEIPLVECLRAVTAVPILLMSALVSADRAIAAGASSFLHFDEWLLVATAVGKLIGARPVAE